MRRTQTFNCRLQKGLLTSLLERTGVERAEVRQVSCTRQGADYCDFRCSFRVPLPSVKAG